MSDNVDKVTLNRAKTALLARDYQLAESLYKSLVDSSPDDVELLSALGDLHVKMNRYEDALEEYKRILEIEPQNLSAINTLGRIYRSLKRYRDSISILEQGIIINEHDIQLFYNLGFAYKDMAQYEEAIQCFNMVLAQKTDDVLAYNHLGSIYLIQGEYDKAITALSKGLRVDPNHPIVHLNLAKAYQGVGNVDAAVKSYEAALRSKPGWIEAIDGYANLLLKQDKNEHAQRLVEQALKLDNNNSEMHTKMGLVFARKDSYEDAANHYNEAIRLQPHNVDAISGLADAYESDGKTVEALKMMELYEKLTPEDVKMLQQYTHVLLSANKINSAYEKIKQVWAKNPDDVKTLNLLGQYYICKGDDAKASGCFTKIKKIDPEYIEYYKDGALRYSQKDELEKAESHLKKYLAIKPNDTKAASMLASNYEKENRFEEAEEIYTSLAQSNSGNPVYVAKAEKLREKVSERNQNSLVDDDVEYVFTGSSKTIDVDESFDNRESDVDESNDIDESENVVHTLGYNMESLTENDDNISPFENVLDDEILASKSNDNSLDALVSHPDDLIDEEDSDDFFRDYDFGRGNPFTKKNDDNMPRFEHESLDDGPTRSNAMEIEEDFMRDDEPPRKPKKSPPKKESPKRDIPEEVFVPEDDDLEELEELEPAVLPQEEKTCISEDDLEPEPVIENEDLWPEEESVPELLSEDIEELDSEEDEEEEPAPEPIDYTQMDELPDLDSEEMGDLDVPDELDALPDVEEQISNIMGDDLSDTGAEELDIIDDIFSEDDIDDVSIDYDDLDDIGELDFTDEDDFDSVESLLDEVFTENSVSEIGKYDKTCSLFKKLKDLVELLPDDKKNDFMNSPCSLAIEFIITRLSGRQGLMSLSDKIRKELDIPSGDVVQDSGKMLVIRVLENVQSMLADVYTMEKPVSVQALEQRMVAVLSKLKGENVTDGDEITE